MGSTHGQTISAVRVSWTLMKTRRLRIESWWTSNCLPYGQSWPCSSLIQELDSSHEPPCQILYLNMQRWDIVIYSKQMFLFVDISLRMSLVATINVFQSSIQIFTSRYILVDWLVEVAEMKELSSQTLHASIALMDRYLKIHPTSRGVLQLLGVVSMLVCSRWVFSTCQYFE